jgi:2-polyprenyl-3-methyl-5-hydroxy-6-metoxy-1,4-benzoquinol methylase
MNVAPDFCPLCQGSINISLETGNVFGDKSKVRSFYHCGSCDVFFQWPRLTVDEESTFYRDEFEKFMESRNDQGGMDWSGPERHVQSNSDQRNRRERYLKPYYERASRGKSPHLLEVGCSSGFMMAGLEAEYGITPVGIEPSGSFAKYLRSQGYQIFQSIDDHLQNSSQDQYDLITNYFVLEHIQDPFAFCRILFGLLKPGGSLIMEVPNAADPLRTVYETQAFKDFYWSIAHPWYFTQKSLSFLLRSSLPGATAEIFLDQRYDIGNHVRWLKDGRPGGQGKLAEIFDSEFNSHFRRCLIQSDRCDTLVAVVTKDLERK